jgi:DNA-directed RNA polymerase subunit M/transcription elongation factor TFIIS
MSLIQFTENYDDLSTDLGFQFKFYCDHCRNGYMSTFQPSVVGTAGSLLRAAGGLFGGALSRAGYGAYEVQRAVGGKGHDDALSNAIAEVKGKFHQCKRCGKWVCPDVCWNEKRGMCVACAPDVQAELAAAQVEAQVEQIHDGVRKVDWTKDMDLAGETVGTCPKCGARAQGKFCPECGAPLAPKAKCPQCGASVDEGVKFCPECGGKMAAAKPKCPGCGKEYDQPMKFCEECGTKMG